LIASLPFDQARRLEAREGVGLDELLERHARIAGDRDRDGEVVHQAAESGTFLVHVDEDLAGPAVLVFAGAQIDLVAADDRLLCITLAPLRQAFAPGPHFALDDPFDDALGNDRRPRDGGKVGEIVVGGSVAQRHRRERLRKLSSRRDRVRWPSKPSFHDMS